MKQKQNERKAIMTTTNKTLIATLAGIALLSFAGPAQAQYRPTGSDGITASPKVRAQLVERRATVNTAPAVAASMLCPKCKDAWVSQVDPTPKGAKVLLSQGRPTNKVAKHLCGGCETTISVVGLSKADRHNVATHTCSGCVAATLACCSTKDSGAGATTGMEKQIEIAPLK